MGASGSEIVSKLSQQTFTSESHRMLYSYSLMSQLTKKLKLLNDWNI